jgi:hypothetical protein
VTPSGGAGPSRLTRLDWGTAALYVCLAVAIGYVDHAVRRFPDHTVTNYIPEVVSGAAEAPAKYRVLAPLIFDRFIDVSGLTPLIGFLVLRALTIWTSLLALHVYFRGWFTYAESVAGVFATAALLPLTFTDSWAHPDTFIELAIFTLGCLAIAERKDAWLPVIIAAGTLNRETTAFLIVLWALDRRQEGWSRRTVLLAAACVAAWAAVYIGARVVRGFQHYDYWMLGENWRLLAPMPAQFDPYRRVFGLFWLVLLIAPGWIAVRGARMADAPPFFRSAAATAGVLVVVAACLARLIEARILTPLFPLLMPPAIWAVARRRA